MAGYMAQVELVEEALADIQSETPLPFLES